MQENSIKYVVELTKINFKPELGILFYLIRNIFLTTSVLLRKILI